MSLAAGLIIAIILMPHLINGTEKPYSITVQTNKPGAEISSTMWGILLEDMNSGIEGSLYAELVKNRSFEFTDPMMGWNIISSSSASGSAEILIQDPVNPANPHYMRIKINNAADIFGVSNEGFCGIGIREGEDYLFSAQVRISRGKPALYVELVAADGHRLARTTLNGLTGQWEKCTAPLYAVSTEKKAKLNIYIEEAGIIDLDMVSLFPKETWKNRSNGLRPDLAQIIADLHPGFVKFPGGFITEGRGFATRYNWKNSIGDPADRIVTISPWNRFSRRPKPDCYFSYGLGLFEYFQFCEDIGAEPVPAVNPGMSAQFTGEVIPMDQLEPYIQDAIDLIEFANGPATSPWGKKRAQMGHLEPFNMKIIRLGNEQSGPQYIERYEQFTEAIKERYPEIKLVSGTGSSPAGDNFKFTWNKLCELKTDIVDQHAHKLPYWFFSNTTRYDSYDRNGPKVMMGEYAAHSEPGLINFNNRNNLNCALSEAVYCTGLERNADIVVMSCYVPLLAHVETWQWKPNLIWFDNLNVFTTPSYYVQQMFSCNRGDVVLPVDIHGPELSNIQKGGFIGMGTWATQAEFKDFKITCTDQIPIACDFIDGMKGWQLQGEGDWKTENGVLRQMSTENNVRAIMNCNFQMGCTYLLKARKMAGSEGFLIFFSVHEEGPLYHWNLGGWDNTQHGIVDEILTQTPGFIETDRWYDIKIELQHGKVNCFLDDKLVQSAVLLSGDKQPLYASAVRDNQSEEIILKVVNPEADDSAVEIKLTGLKDIERDAKTITLTSANLDEVNSLDEPGKIVPVESKFHIEGPHFIYRFPKYSFTVLRIKVQS